MGAQQSLGGHGVEEIGLRVLTVRWKPVIQPQYHSLKSNLTTDVYARLLVDRALFVCLLLAAGCRLAADFWYRYQ